MSLRFWCAWLLLVPASIAGAAACGGSAFESAGGTAGANSSGGTASAGAHQGGSLNGGATGLAGASSGGTGGMSSGGASVGGSGEAGGGGIDMTACTRPSECMLESVSCCSCGSGPVTDFTAINAKWDSAYSQRCATADCAGCPPVAYDPNNPVFYYVPTCAAGHCTVVDLKKTDMTECATASDCTMRSGTACCPSCSGGSVVALNQAHESELSQLVCDSSQTSCPACVTPGQPAWSLACESGRCVLGGPTPCSEASPCPL